MQADWIKCLIDIVEGQILDHPSVLTTLRSVNGSASTSHGRATEETNVSKDVKAPEELENTGGPVTIEQHLQLTMNKWHKRVQDGDIPATSKYPLCTVCLKLC